MYFQRFNILMMASLRRWMLVVCGADGVRRLIGLRPPSDWIAFAVWSDCVRVTMAFSPLKWFVDSSKSSIFC